MHLVNKGRKNIINRLAVFSMLLPSVVFTSIAQAQDSSSDWGFNALVGWAWRDINGTMFSYSPPLNGAATADSLGLGTSSEPEAAIGIRWKRLNVELVYLPSEFKGDGVLVQDLDFGSGPVIGNTTSISSNIEVTMLLANVEYAVFQRSDMQIGVGFGLGQVGLDIMMVPQIGPEINIKGDVPFGYVTTSIVKRWGKVALNGSLQGLSISHGSTGVKYNSVNLAGAYRFIQKEKLGFDVLAGYRFVSFDYEFDDENSGARTGTDLQLTGPYVGVRATW